jgi:hypothetical protein
MSIASPEWVTSGVDQISSPVFWSSANAAFGVAPKTAPPATTTPFGPSSASSYFFVQRTSPLSRLIACTFDSRSWE